MEKRKQHLINHLIKNTNTMKQTTQSRLTKLENEFGNWLQSEVNTGKANYMTFDEWKEKRRQANKSLNIYDIKRLTAETSPHYFTRSTLKFFHQTMSDFSVKKQPDGRIKISAPMRDNSGKVIGKSERFFNPANNELERN